MQPINLPQTPNVSFTLVIGPLTYRIRIYDVGPTMCADININGSDVINGVRCLHADFLLPWPSLEQGNGNFMFFDDNGGIPHWEKFGITSNLYYISPAELVR